MLRKRDRDKLDAAVRLGSSYLDENPDAEPAFEEWFMRVDTAVLNMARSDSCIIGQTLGWYSKIRQVDDFESFSDFQMNRWATQHGFLVSDRKRKATAEEMRYSEMYGHNDDGYRINVEWREEAYAYLDALWTAEVEARQLGRSLTESLTAASETS